MVHRRLLLFLILGFTASGSLLAAGTGSITGEVYERQRESREQSLLVGLSGASFDGVGLDLKPRLAQRATASLLPDGWEIVPGAGLQLRGPSLDSGRFRFDFPAGTDLPRRVNVTIVLDGQPLWEQRLEVQTLPPVETKTDAAGVFHLPPLLQLGDPFLFHTTLPDPENLQISLTPEGSDQTVRLPDSVRLGDYFALNLGVPPDAFETVPSADRWTLRITDPWGEDLLRASVDFQLDPPSPSTPVGFEWETITPRVGLTYALGEERKALLKASYAQYADQLYSSYPGRPDPGTGFNFFYSYFYPSAGRPDAQAGTPTVGEPRSCFGYQDGNGNGEWDRDELGLPLTLNRRFSNNWQLFGSAVYGEGTRPEEGLGTRCGRPSDLLADRPLFVDPSGRIGCAGGPDPMSDEVLVGVEHAFLPTFTFHPVITGVPDMALAGESFCVCGDVGHPGVWRHLQIGGTPLGDPLAASPSTAFFQLPFDVATGPQSVNWIWVTDEDAPSGQQTTLVRVEGSIDQEKLWKGEGTELHLRLIGTEKPLPFTLENMTPGVVSLGGGNRQELVTSGGADNRVSRPVQGIEVGNFDIQYTFDLGQCPCTQPPTPEVAQQKAQTIDDISKQLGSIQDGTSPAPTAPPTTEPIDLLDGRFQVRANFKTDLGATAPAAGTQLGNDGGLFYFLDPNNWELIVKMLDSCPTNNRFWVFAGGLTNVEYTIQVTDTETDTARNYVNLPSGPYKPIQDTSAFATCP